MKRIATRMRAAAAALLVSMLAVSCGGESSPEPSQQRQSQQSQSQGDQPESDAAVRIEGAGATFPAPLYQTWIKEYEQEHPDVDFSYEGVGSGEGIKRFIAGEVDFGASDAAMKDDEIAKVGGGVKLIPITAGMVVLAYNLPGVEGDLKLPRDVYPDIFQAKIWRWDDPRIVAANPDLDLPSKLIQTVVRRDSSGTTYAFTNHLSAASPAWREGGPGTAKLLDWPGGAMTGNGNEGVAQKVKLSHGSIGYMEYGFARRLGLPVAILENQAGNYVKPDAASGRAALEAAAEKELPEDLRLFLPDPAGPDSYPIVSPTWILLYSSYDDPEKARVLKDAITWGLTEGQATAEEMGYIPLPDNLVAEAREAVETIQ